MANNTRFHLRCLSEAEMLLTAGKLPRFINIYLLNFVILFGVTGNIINLTVLLTPSMRSRSNKLLAALAFADILFLLFMAPHSLATYSILEFNLTFRKFYFSIKQSTTALANWASAVAIWLTLTICFERLVGIRYPLSSRKRRICNTKYLVAGITVFTGVLTAFHHFKNEEMIGYFCNGTQIFLKEYPRSAAIWGKNTPIKNPHTQLFQTYISSSNYVNAIIVVFLPTLVILVSNVLLVKTLNERKQFLRVSTSLKCDLDGRSPSTNQMTTQLRNEQRITLTVCLIVTCFICTQTPSAVLVVVDGLNYSSYWLTIAHNISNLMVPIGKAMNFVLFCLSSSTFRQRLISLTKSRFSRSFTTRAGQKSRSGMSRKLSVETSMTIACPCNENHSLLRTSTESCRCSRALSLNETKRKVFSKNRTNTVELGQRLGTDL
ncbi:G-PROTEIN-RECEP-F1-2 domain-containing protein [Aphelenchoides besseyi]|nr:G-PROTEIN-RECEP-F1-2 domain-containing protein [Aphelenchoides besseyi]